MKMLAVGTTLPQTPHTKDESSESNKAVRERNKSGTLLLKEREDADLRRISKGGETP